jgi:hypothetical protein
MTRHDKTKQDNTRQDKKQATGQDTTSEDRPDTNNMAQIQKFLSFLGGVDSYWLRGG